VRAALVVAAALDAGTIEAGTSRVRAATTERYFTMFSFSC
jgi:hypothetical protein